MPKKKAKAARGQSRQHPDTNRSGNSSGIRLKAICIRVLFFGVFMAISGFGISIYWNYTHPPKPLHTFSEKERSTFIQALKANGAPTRSVWLSCPEGKPEICRLVRQFIAMFQESGWRVEDSKVVQWTPAHPLGGVYLILQADGEPDDLTRIAEKGMKNSFTALGIPVHSAAAPDVPRNSIGVYFGPDM
ncbi:MAG TPA: hypothetical protein VFO86_12040 [Terriglobia bacterium]|nr:hypothetical protein [Terriglobia bacterium]